MCGSAAGHASGCGQCSGRQSSTPSIALPLLARLFARLHLRPARSNGCSLATERPRLGQLFPPPRSASATTSSSRWSRRRDTSLMRVSRPRRSTAGKERRAATPAQARNFLDAMRGLFRWALKAGLVRVDPTVGVNNPPRKRGDGFIAWTEEDVEAYEARWPIGTRQRVWLDVLLYTGLRRGDAIQIGRQHERDGVATLKTEKSGFTLEVTLPILPVLARTLAPGPTGDLSYHAGERGQPLTKRASATYSRPRARRPVYPAPRMVSARSQRHARPMLARPSRS